MTPTKKPGSVIDRFNILIDRSQPVIRYLFSPATQPMIDNIVIFSGTKQKKAITID